jgi:hypothetical protein
VRGRAPVGPLAVALATRLGVVVELGRLRGIGLHDHREQCEHDEHDDEHATRRDEGERELAGDEERDGAREDRPDRRAADVLRGSQHVAPAGLELTGGLGHECCSVPDAAAPGAAAHFSENPPMTR